MDNKNKNLEAYKAKVQKDINTSAKALDKRTQDLSEEEKAALKRLSKKGATPKVIQKMRTDK